MQLSEARYYNNMESQNEIYKYFYGNFICLSDDINFKRKRN